MTDPVDPADLAARFLDLWQESLSAIAADTELLDAMNRSFAAVGFGAAALAGFTGAGFGSPTGGTGFGGFSFTPGAAGQASSSDHSAPFSDPKATEAQDARPSSGQKPGAGSSARPAQSGTQAHSGTTPASPSSHGGMESLAELAERVRLLEDRFASLASVDARRPRRSSEPSHGNSPEGSRRRSSS